MSRTAREIITGMTPAQKAVGSGLVLLVLVIVGWSMIDRISTWRELRTLRNEAATAKRDAQTALANAAKIALAKAEAEKKVAELEAKRDGKVTEVEAAVVDAHAARIEHGRTQRERRGDNPSPEQLCRELATLGYPCE